MTSTAHPTTTSALPTVADVMTTPAATCVRDQPVSAAAHLMNDRGISSLIVVAPDGSVDGIITERDILHAAGGTADLHETSVADWMTAIPDCLSPDTATDVAWRQLAERGYRHLPVVDDDGLRGVVGLRDLASLADLRPAAEAFVAPAGLKGVIVSETGLGDVRGQEGFYHYREYAAPDLARLRSFEDVWHLLVEGHLPDRAEAAAFRAELAPLRRLDPAVLQALPAIAGASRSVNHALRTALSLHAANLDLANSMDVDQVERRRHALALSAVVPTLIAAIHRLRSNREPVAPDDGLGHAANYLWMLDGTRPDESRARAIEKYLILGIDHGFNASTFTTRVVTSTGSDLGSAVVAGLGALLGPLHGGAPSRALDTLDEIGTPDRAEAWVRERVGAGERIMGFGHPVYRVADPRSVMLRAIAQELGGDLVDFAVQVEATVEATLAELKPDHPLHTNVEWYAAVVMDRCGLDRTLFTPTFAASRIVGWCAQALEQAADNRIIRPSSRYVGTPPPVEVPVAE